MLEKLQIIEGFGLFSNIEYTAFNQSSRIKCKLTPGMELFEEYFRLLLLLLLLLNYYYLIIITKLLLHYYY